MECIFDPYGDLIFRKKWADIDIWVCLFCRLLPHMEIGSEKKPEKIYIFDSFWQGGENWAAIIKFYRHRVQTNQHAA